MDCRNFETLSQLYIDEELDTECVTQFEAHLLTCDHCKREMQYLHATIQGIESYPQIEARSDLADNVMARIEWSTSQWDFTHELERITGALSQLSSRQLARYPIVFAAMTIGLIHLPSRIYLRVCRISLQRLHAALVPPLAKWIHLAKTQIKHPIMNSLRRYT